MAQGAVWDMEYTDKPTAIQKNISHRPIPCHSSGIFITLKAAQYPKIRFKNREEKGMLHGMAADRVKKRRNFYEGPLSYL